MESGKCYYSNPVTINGVQMVVTVCIINASTGYFGNVSVQIGSVNIAANDDSQFTYNNILYTVNITGFMANITGLIGNITGNGNTVNLKIPFYNVSKGLASRGISNTWKWIIFFIILVIILYFIWKKCRK